MTNTLKVCKWSDGKSKWKVPLKKKKKNTTLAALAAILIEAFKVILKQKKQLYFLRPNYAN